MAEKKKKSNVKTIVIMLLLVLSALIIVFVAVSPHVVAMKVYKKQAKDKIGGGSNQVFKSALSSIVYDKDGEEIIVFRSELDEYYVYSENLSDVAKYAFIQLTDQGFYSKNGADTITMFNITKDDEKAAKEVEGISSVTRMIARDTFLSYDIEKDNSVIEVYVANELERVYSKDELYEFYINNLYFNNGYYGVGSAARGYFGKNLDELSTSQIAFLAALAEDASLNPDTDLESIMVKRNVIITRLYEAGIIDRAEYFRAISEIVDLHEGQIKQYNYVETYVINCVVHSLMENDGFVFRNTFDSEEVKEDYEKLYTKAYTNFYQDLFKKGYRIYTAFDMKLQDNLQKEVDNAINMSEIVNENGEPALSGAAVILDNETSKVIAIVGGESVETTEYVYNRAFQSYLPGGMVMAPLDSYIPFIEWHHNPDYIVYREEAVDGTFINKVTLREAILGYSDEFTTKVYGLVTPQYGLSLLDRIGFSKALNASKEADAWGDVSASVTELAAGYLTIAKDGSYVPVTCIVRIDDNAGNTVYTPVSASISAYAANDSRIMNEILAYNIKEGFLKNYAVSDAITAAMASEAGHGHESYFVGYSNYYTVAAYMGFNGLSVTYMEENELPDTTDMAGALWRNVMYSLHTDKELSPFPENGPYSQEPEAEEEVLQPTTERPSLGGTGGHPEDGDDYIGGYTWP